MTELAETLGTTPGADCAGHPRGPADPKPDARRTARTACGSLTCRWSPPEEALSDRIGLAEVMDRLDSGDRQLIRLRFFAGRTQSETARVLGTTQVQISRRERRILKWMREQLLDAL